VNATSSLIRCHRRTVGLALTVIAASTLVSLAAIPDVAHARDTDRDPCAPVEFTSPAIEQLRREQQRHMEAFNKFPDSIEVGSAVWEDVWEWHVRVLQQQPGLIDTADGRYGLLFRRTLVVLRNDAPANYQGSAVDLP
jgi:hypothetical protein